MNRIRVALFNDAATAEPIREHLRQAGIPAEIHHEPWLAWLWFVSQARAGVRIEVPAKMLGTTEALFRAWDAEGILFTGIRCPDCGSMRVDFPQFTEKSFITNLAFGLLAGLGLVEKDYYCEHCHWMWPKPDAKRQ
jgi:hypothetical protein